jgi:hypothetical protein
VSFLFLNQFSSLADLISAEMAEMTHLCCVVCGSSLLWHREDLCRYDVAAER